MLNQLLDRREQRVVAFSNADARAAPVHLRVVHLREPWVNVSGWLIRLLHFFNYSQSWRHQYRRFSPKKSKHLAFVTVLTLEQTLELATSTAAADISLWKSSKLTVVVY